MLVIEKHPDKPGGITSEFQMLRDAYNKIGEIIQNTAQNDVNDVEETLARKLFKETNLEKINAGGL